MAAAGMRAAAIPKKAVNHATVGLCIHKIENNQHTS
jgi:hypothetical protein